MENFDNHKVIVVGNGRKSGRSSLRDMMEQIGRDLREREEAENNRYKENTDKMRDFINRKCK